MTSCVSFYVGRIYVHNIRKMPCFAVLVLCTIISVEFSQCASLNSPPDELFELQMGESAITNNAHTSNRAGLDTNDMNTPVDLDELRKLGINVDKILDHLKQWIAIQQCDQSTEDALLTKHYITNKTVTCNDGSQAGYYIRKSQGSNKWIVFLEGGWYCYDKPSCRGRFLNTPHLMSSLQWPDTRKGHGILSGDREKNPHLHDANVVYVPYCSSDSWSGTYRSATRGDFSFMGALILEEIMKDLLRSHGLDKGRQLYLAGSSAGGIGVLLNLDHVSGLLTQRVPSLDVRGIADSGWFLDNEQYRPIGCNDAHSCAPTTVTRRGIQLWHGRVPHACRLAYPGGEEWRCYFGYRMYPTLKTPVFVIQHLFDEAQITVDNVGPPIKKEQWQYIHNMGKDIANTLRNVSAVFAPACLSHILLTRDEWNRVSINGVSLPEALKCWMDGKKEKNHYSGRSKARHKINQLITGQYVIDRTYAGFTQGDDPKSTEKRRRQRRRRKNKKKRKDRTRADRGRNRGSRREAREEFHLLTAGGTTVYGTPPSGEVGDTYFTDSGGPFGTPQTTDNYRDAHSTILSRTKRAVLFFDQHDLHNMRYHDNLCTHYRVDQCAWPQCNLSCPKIHNPFTGEEMDFIDLLLQFGLDLSSIANALGMDLPTMQSMDHDRLLKLLTQQR